MSFLTAEWRKLVLINYEIDPYILTPYVPHGTVLDFWKERCYISVVGFMFKNTRLLGIRIPFHVNFEEVNLRFYVKRKVGKEWRRGVVFIREIVPKPALTFVANSIYKEHYVTRPMRHEWITNGNRLSVGYQWKEAGNWNYIKVEAENTPTPILPGEEAEFITEHYWGYARIDEKRTNEYEVTHPRWEHYPIRSFDLSIDFENNYGKDFSFLKDVKPLSVMLAEGSEITVEKHKGM